MSVDRKNTTAIKIEGLDKTFKLPHDKQSSIKGALIHLFNRGHKGYEVQQALEDISFEVKKGEFFGIVGRNGSGKSTLLKLMAGIYTPDKGKIDIKGRLIPFIELGVGFSPELTGRDNVFLNGSLLGFSREEMSKMYDDIVKFAELGRFMDQKLKNYSSGMQVRLAFSIAIRANADILVLDEVLAVGDEAFQKKCFNYFEQLKRDKKTVVLVTHDMASVERFCDRAMMIEDSKVVKIGDPFKVAAAYSRSNDESYNLTMNDNKKDKEPKKSDIEIKLLDSSGKPTNKFTHGDTMTVELSWSAPKVNYVGVSVVSQNGQYIFGTNTFQEKYELTRQGSIKYDIALNVGSGDYYIVAGLFGKNDNDRIDFEEQGPSFTVNRDYNDSRWGGYTKLDFKWH